MLKKAVESKYKKCKQKIETKTEMHRSTEKRKTSIQYTGFQLTKEN